MKIVYLDNGATTKVYPEVVEVMAKCHLENYGNSSSRHSLGDTAKDILESSRKTIADSINAKPEEIIFTSGGTESNNLAIKGITISGNKKHIIISKIEHDCILNSAKSLEKHGFEITYLDVDKEGFVSPDILEAAIREDTALVSIIHANNEIGTIQNLPSLYSICKEKGVYFHTDACQSYTKELLTADMADLITLNAHKIHGPKGIGALYIKDGVKLSPQINGGGHEKGIRSGTENIPSIAGFAKTVELKYSEDEIKTMTKLRDYLINGLLKIPGSILNGPAGTKRLCSNVNISFNDIEGESIVALFNHYGICASTGSACSSNTLDASHVMLALEDSHGRAHSSTRFSLSKYTTKEELDYTIQHAKEIVQKLRDFSPLKTVT